MLMHADSARTVKPAQIQEIPDQPERRGEPTLSSFRDLCVREMIKGVVLGAALPVLRDALWMISEFGRWMS